MSRNQLQLGRIAVEGGVLRLTFIHDWLTGMRGGEKCLERFCVLFPDSELFTLLHRQDSTSTEIERRTITTSWLQKLPGWSSYYRYLLPLMPKAIEQMAIPSCDAVVSLSHCVAKSAIVPAGVPHVCYCFTPMRYAWHQQTQYFDDRGPKSWIRNRILARIREWDRRTSDRVTHFIAISETIRQRIRECYGRDSTVIYPPVDTDYYRPAAVERENYFLVVSAFAPYKRIDHAVTACTRLHRPLVVIGTGQDEKKLRRVAGPKVTFLGWQTDETIRHHMRRCRALLFPGEEDFGIVPVEAQACGTPVIALGRGGATETVCALNSGESKATGWLYDNSSVDNLITAIESFDRHHSAFDPMVCRRWAEQFATSRFDAEIYQFMTKIVDRSTRLLRAA